MVQGSLQSLEVDLQAESAYGESAQKNGFAAGETTFGALNGAPAWRGIEILDDGFGLAASMQRNNQAIKANLQVQRQGEIVGIETTGSINPVAAGLDKRTAYDRSPIAWILGSALNRDATTNELRSYSMRWHTPNVSTETFLGCKVQSLTVEASEDNGTVDFTSEWISAAYSIANDVAASPIFPQQLLQTTADTGGSPGTGWTFSRAYVLIDGTAIATIRSLSVTVNNNLEPSSPKVKTEIDGAGDIIDTFVIAELREQTPSISGNIVLDYLDHTYTDLMLADTEFEVVVLARHPQSNVFGVLTLPTQAGTGTWTLTDTGDATWQLDESVGSFKGAGTPAAADFGLIAGGAILVENTEPASVLDYERDITVLTNAYETTGDTVIGDEGNLAYWTPVGTAFSSQTVGDYLVYDQAMGLRFTGMKIDSAPQEGGAADIIGQNLSIVGGQFDPALAPVLWVAGNAGNDIA